MVNTRRSSVGLNANVERTTTTTTTTDESFSTTFSLQSYWKRVGKLSENQKKAIERTGFGNLLKIPPHRLSKTLLAELMERWCPDKHSFLLVPTRNSSNITLKITLTDVALVLGLRVTGNPVILCEDEQFSDLEKEFGATVGKRKISVSTIEKRLDSFGDDVNDDFVRSFLLFTFGKLLFPCADSKVDSRYLSLLKDLDKVRSFAWGEAVLKDITHWLCKRKKNCDQAVGGCLIFLQIWSYEHINLARPKLLEDNDPEKPLFPRACRWENNKPQPRQWFRTKFKELDKDQVVCKLHLTPQELNIDIITAINKVDENRTRLNSMDQWIAEKAQEPDLIVVREVRRTEGECSDQLRGQIETPLSTPHNSSLPVVIISEDDDEEKNIANTEETLLKENAELKKEINSLREKNNTIKNLLNVENAELKKEINSMREENKTIKDQHEVENAELKKEINSLREEHKTIKDLEEENAELRNLRDENKVLKDQLEGQNVKLDDLRKENRLVSSSEKGLLTELEIILHDLVS